MDPKYWAIIVYGLLWTTIGIVVWNLYKFVRDRLRAIDAGEERWDDGLP